VTAQYPQHPGHVKARKMDMKDETVHIVGATKSLLSDIKLLPEGTRSQIMKYFEEMLAQRLHESGYRKNDKR
jgi:hypothetical protein